MVKCCWFVGGEGLRKGGGLGKFLRSASEVMSGELFRETLGDLGKVPQFWAGGKRVGWVAFGLAAGLMVGPVWGSQGRLEGGLGAGGAFGSSVAVGSEVVTAELGEKGLPRNQAPPVVNPRVLQQAKTENVSVYVSLGRQRAWLFVGKEMALETPISSGKKAAMTPRGHFEVLQKLARMESPLYGDFVDRWGRAVRVGVSSRLDSAPSGTVFRATPMVFCLRLNWEGLMLHAGVLPGYPAADGNVRLPPEIARIVFEMVAEGTPVVIGD